jgi:phosphoserine phosphatase RsbU/P
MSFRIKLLLLSSLSVLAGMSVITIIALLGINNLNKSASADVEKGLLTLNQDVIKSIMSPNSSQLAGVNAAQFAGLLSQLRIGQDGFMFAAQTNGTILSINEERAKLLGLQKPTSIFSIGYGKISESSNPEIARLPFPTGTANPTTLSEVTLSGKPYQVFIQYASFSGGANEASIPIVTGFVVSKEEALKSLSVIQNNINESAQNIFWTQLIATFVVLAIVVTVAFFLSNRMTTSLKALTAGAGRIQNKQYDTKVEIKSRDEFGRLGAAFNGMATEIQRYTNHLEDEVAARTKDLQDANSQITRLNDRLKSENVRLKAEVEVTRQLQQMILPKEHELANVEGLDIAGYMNPADEVGGDYYDVLQSNGVVKIGIGDVTGHGLESGVLMLMVQTAVRTLLASHETDPTRFMSVLNRTIYDNVQRMNSDKNLTLMLVDYEKGNVRLSGQHESAILVRHTGETEVIDTLDLGFPVGLEENIADFVNYLDVRLLPGDVMVLYTDGIPEAANHSGERYGLERLVDSIQQSYNTNAAAIKDTILRDFDQFIAGRKLKDDVTFVVIKQR